MGIYFIRFKNIMGADNLAAFFAMVGEEDAEEDELRRRRGRRVEGSEGEGEEAGRGEKEVR